MFVLEQVLANMSSNASYQQHLLGFNYATLVLVYTTPGTGNILTPRGYFFSTVEAIGGGGNGFGSNTTNQRASGGGGTSARSNTKIAVQNLLTIVYYSVGAAATDSWVNIGTNAVPTSATTGCLAIAGSSGSAGVAGKSVTTGAIGALFVGGQGATGNNSNGGGGAGVSSAGSKQTAGTDTTLLSPHSRMGYGTGGTYNSATLGPGTAPGGGGGGAAATGTNYAGAVGKVRIIFYRA